MAAERVKTVEDRKVGGIRNFQSNLHISRHVRTIIPVYCARCQQESATIIAGNQV